MSGSGAPKGLESILDEMVRQYTSWPRELVESFESALRVRRSSPPRGSLVVGCGMGGSGFTVDAARLLLEERGFRVVPCKCHTPPPYVGPDTLVVAVSFSGSTVETLECASRSLERGAQVWAVAGEGSRLHRLVAEKGYPVATVKTTGLPRTSLARLVGSMLGLLLDEADRRVVERVASSLDPGWALEESRRIAEALKGKPLPVIVACGAYEALAVRWRTELAENAKIHALVEAYPEAGHNSVNVWGYQGVPGGSVFLVIKASVGDRVCEAVESWAVEEYSRHGEVVTLDLTGPARVHGLAALLAGSMVAGVASAMLAVSLGRDPSATPGIKRYRETVERAHTHH